MKRSARLLLLFVMTLCCFACNKESDDQINGYIEARLTIISAPLSGRLEHMPHLRGARIKQGDILAELEAEPEGYSVQIAKANLAAVSAELDNMLTGKRQAHLDIILSEISGAHAQLVYAEKELKRHKKLAESGNIQEEILDKSIANVAVAETSLDALAAKLDVEKLPGRKSEIESAKARVQAAEKALAQQGWALAQKTLLAPADGVVYDTYYRVGEEIGAFKPILSLLTPNEVKAVFYVPETKLSALGIGQVITIACDNCKEPLAGKVSFISPIAEYTPPILYSERARTKLVFRVEASLSANEHLSLHPGLPISITLAPNSHG